MTQDIYHQNEPPTLARRRRWLSLRRPGLDTPSTAASVGAGTALRIQEVPRSDEQRVRRRRRSDHSPQVALLNSITWLSVLVVAVGYLAILAGVEFWMRRHPPAKNVPVSAKPATPAPAPTIASSSLPLAENMAHWQRGLKAYQDILPKLEKGLLADSQKKLEQVLAEMPDLTKARLELARILIRQKQFGEAADLLVAVLNSDPDLMSARLALGQTYMDMGQSADALAVAQWIIETDSFSVAAQDMAATALLNLNRPAEAIVHLKKLVTLNGDDLGIQNNLGATYLKTGDYRSALLVFREILRASPDNTMAHYNIAITYARQGKVAETVEALASAIKLFGAGFVSTWISSSEFDPVREDPAFTGLLSASPTAVPAPEPAAN